MDKKKGASVYLPIKLTLVLMDRMPMNWIPMYFYFYSNDHMPLYRDK